MTTFDDIIGYEKIVDELKKLKDILTNKEKYKSLGIEIPQALLIYGDPGLGKTLMAKALINEVGHKCFYCKKNRPEGEFVAQISATFKDAINNAPSIVFLDDMDKFAEDNLQQNCNKEEFVTIQSCLEDIRKRDVFVIATANEIYNLPDSLLRTGRFGRQIEIKSPNHSDSVKIIEHYLKKRPIPCEVPAESFAYILSDSSCVTLESVVNEASIIAGYNNQTTITRNNVAEAVGKVVFNTSLCVNLTDSEKYSIAVHEAGHASMSMLLGVPVAISTIKPAQKFLGTCQTILIQNMFSQNRLRETALTGLAGKCATELIFGRADYCVGSDFSKVASTIQDALEESAIEGFDYFYNYMSFDHKQSSKRVDLITDKVCSMMESYCNECKTMLEEHKDLLCHIADALVKNEILIYDELQDIFNYHVNIGETD